MTTKIPVELSSTPGISDSSNATAITIDSSENSTFTGDVTVAAGKKFTTASGNDLNIVYPDSRSLFIKEDSTTHVTVDNTGKVGIGTTSPTAPLHIATSTDDAYSLRLEGATNNSANYHGIGFSGESSNTKAAILFKDIASSYSRGDLLFCVNDDADQTNVSDSDAVMTLKNNGSMLLHGGETSGIQEVIFNNGGLTINYQSSYTLSGVLNTGALIAIGQQRSSSGVTYDHCLLFAETGTAFVTLADPSSRFAINSATTSNKTNIFVNGADVVIMNEVGTNQPYTIAVFKFQGN
jgi:hypothetical protein